MEIQLGGKKCGKTLVSEKDYEYLSQFKWHQNGAGYVTGRVNCKQVRMHRLIIERKIGECPNDKFVDHIDGNKLNNRRSNLKLCTQLENMQNRVKRNDVTSKFRGVYYDKQNKNFRARKTYKGKSYNIGSYKTEIEAAKAYDSFILKYCINSPLNFSSEQINCESDIKQSGCNGNLSDVKPRSYNFTKKNKMKTEYESLSEEDCIRLLTANCNQITIDREDYEKIKHFKCSVIKTTGYVRINIPSNRQLLHRYLLKETDPSIFIDHIDGNKLNNTKKNLRRSNAKFNSQNKLKMQNTSSSYIGIYKRKENGKYSASVTHDHKRIHISDHINEEEAARKRDLYILTNFPDSHYKMNFEWTEKDKKKWRKHLDI